MKFTPLGVDATTGWAALGDMLKDGPNIYPRLVRKWPVSADPAPDAQIALDIQTENVPDGTAVQIELHRRSDSGALAGQTISGATVQSNAVIVSGSPDPKQRAVWTFPDDKAPRELVQSDDDRVYAVVTITDGGDTLTQESNDLKIVSVRTIMADRIADVSMGDSGGGTPTNANLLVAYDATVDTAGTAASIRQMTQFGGAGNEVQQWMLTDASYQAQYELSVFARLFKNSNVFHYAGYGGGRCKTDQKPYSVHTPDGVITANCEHEANADNAESLLAVGAKATRTTDSSSATGETHTDSTGQPVIGYNSAQYVIPFDSCLVVTQAEIGQTGDVINVPCDLVFLASDCSALDSRLAQAFLDRGTRNVIAFRGPVTPDLIEKWEEFYEKWDGKPDTISSAYMATLAALGTPSLPMLFGTDGYTNPDGGGGSSTDWGLIAGLALGAVVIAAALAVGIAAIATHGKF